ncbi:MAG: DUF4412 domain-containing protein [Polyangiales bacterium]
MIRYNPPQMLGISVRSLGGLLTVCAVILQAGPALAFEGELTAILSAQPGQSVTVHAWYSDTGDVRIDTAGKGQDGQLLQGSTILPASGGVYYSVSHNQKVIVEVPFAALRSSSQDVSSEGADSNLEIKKLGREPISGTPTEHVRVLDKDNNATIDLWMTQKYPPDLWTQAFRGRDLGLELSDEERVKAMRKYGVKPGFAMKMKVRQPGRPPVEFLVKSIKRGSVPQGQFALPTGYRRVSGATDAPQQAPPKP